MHFYISVVSMIRPHKVDVYDVVQLYSYSWVYMFTLLADTGSTDEPILVTSAVAVSVFAMGL